MGSFTHSDVSQALVQRFRLHSDPPRMFAEETFIESPSDSVSRVEVMQEFSEFCKRWNYSGKQTREKVFAALRRTFPDIEDTWKTVTKGKSEIKEQIRVFSGIGLLCDEADYRSHLRRVVEQRQEAIGEAGRAIAAAQKARISAERAESSAVRSEQTAKNAGTATAMKRRVMKSIEMIQQSEKVVKDVAVEKVIEEKPDSLATEKEIEALVKKLEE